jgi:cell wall-associated NlpC family hydrolase
MNDIRARVVDVARSYLGTPYHAEARIKGVGVDCATLLAGVYEEAGAISRMSIEHYPMDWHLHRGGERYVNTLLKHATETAGPPLPGDIAIWKFGRAFSHGAIVTQWPMVIHACMNSCVREEDAMAAQWLITVGEGGPMLGKPRPRKFFTLWADTDGNPLQEQSSAGERSPGG